MSSGVPAGVVANTASVAESIPSSTPVPAGATHAPPMYSLSYVLAACVVMTNLVSAGVSDPIARYRRRPHARRGSVDLTLAPLPVGRTQLELLQLAGGGA